ncbi:MAG: hypothetical protein JNM77_12645 [Pseudonocardia sp.]|nr:hypothetical protein [Pseudonocardia sp.]
MSTWIRDADEQRWHAAYVLGLRAYRAVHRRPRLLDPVCETCSAAPGRPCQGRRGDGCACPSRLVDHAEALDRYRAAAQEAGHHAAAQTT